MVVLLRFTTSLRGVHRYNFAYTPWSRIFLKNATAETLVKNFHDFYETRRFIAMSSSTSHSIPPTVNVQHIVQLPVTY